MKKYFALLFLCFCIFSNANVKLPLLFNDGMVLQRNKPIPVWGWASANEKVEIHFNKQIVKTIANKNGKWTVKLKAEKAGGPFELVIKGNNTITLKNVLVGEVWICSGQSNMEFKVKQAMNAKQEISNADFPMIRQFLVEKDMSSIPKEDFKSAKWTVCNKENVGDFTAVGYFFARKIYAELKVPIGIINTSWGGTCSETWTSREAFEKSDEFKDMIARIPKIDMDSLAENQRKSIVNKIERIQGSRIKVHADPQFRASNFDDTNWPKMQIPSLWEQQQLPGLDGVVWMRKSVVISKEDAGKEATIELSKIDDQDITYINGVEIGTTNKYDEKRLYRVPAGVLKEGKNVISVKVIDYSGGGGIWGDEADLKLTLQNNIISLSGEWKFNVVEIETGISPNDYPSLLYNAMINPLVTYAFQGVLWYQGEANVNRAEQYKKAFPLMIKDWRTKCQPAGKAGNKGNFPFYFVQLSTFDEFGGNSKNGSKWAELREAQTYTLQTVANTGMAVTTDIGNAKDIHPTNKQDVGKRLAAIALSNVYGKKVVYSGPIYKSQEIKGNQIILTFDNIGSGLSTSDKNGILKGFEIAGADKIFHLANAIIDNNRVILSSEKVQNPVAVRYGWADDDTEINLFNNEKFPASPFRTDNWDTITKDGKYNVEK